MRDSMKIIVLHAGSPVEEDGVSAGPYARRDI
jgi:hypothetical protein